MELFEAIAKRHSYRGEFTEDPVTNDQLKKIVQAAIQAPSGKNMQTTTFGIIQDKGLVKKIQQMHPKNPAMQTAQAYIVCIFDKQPETVYEGMSFQVEDCAAATENMLLAITDLGLATVWIDGWLRVENRAQKVAKIINLTDDKIVRIILPVGKPKEAKKQAPKKPFQQRAFFDTYGAN